MESRDERQTGAMFVSELQETSSVINDAAAIPQHKPAKFAQTSQSLHSLKIASPYGRRP